jgi:excisionase family DNA binding protein
VSIDAVAAHVGVRKDSIYRWIEGRGLPAAKVGKLWKLKLSEGRRRLRFWTPHYCSNLTNSFACGEVAESYNPSPEGCVDLFCRDQSD